MHGEEKRADPRRIRYLRVLKKKGLFPDPSRRVVSPRYRKLVSAFAFERGLLSLLSYVTRSENNAAHYLAHIKELV